MTDPLEAKPLLDLGQRFKEDKGEDDVRSNAADAQAARFRKVSI
jgi:hypothetical protein